MEPLRCAVALARLSLKLSTNVHRKIGFRCLTHSSSNRLEGAPETPQREPMPLATLPQIHSRSEAKTPAFSTASSRSPRYPLPSNNSHSPQYDLSRAPSVPTNTKETAKSPTVTSSVRSLLPHLLSQPPFYAVIHIHGKPYLVTAGDSLRLPFLMHGVRPGDVLRLNRASRIGSREYTLIAGSDAQSSDINPEPTHEAPIIGRTEDLPHTPYPKSSTAEASPHAGLKKKGPPSYVDDRFFTCRAVVTGTEAEPMRVKEKTKRRQRRVKHIKSKHKFTMLKIREISLNSLSSLETEPVPS